MLRFVAVPCLCSVYERQELINRLINLIIKELIDYQIPWKSAYSVQSYHLAQAEEWYKNTYWKDKRQDKIYVYRIF
jgi:hypothetical protein